MTTIAIIVIAVLVSYFVFVKRKSSTENPGTLGFNGGNVIRKSAKNTVTPRNPWRASSIVHSENACDAVKAISGKRFLNSERTIPVVPLPDCDATQCNCKYARHEDRREITEDRRSSNALHADLYDRTGSVNRRETKRGRRKTDWA